MTSQPSFVPAVIILVASIPLVLGLVPRHRAYCIRTRKALPDMVFREPLRGVDTAESDPLLPCRRVAFLVLHPRGARLFPWSLDLTAFVGRLLLGVLLIRQYARHP
jgi:hypothetical protein